MVLWVGEQHVIVVFPNHTRLPFFKQSYIFKISGLHVLFSVLLLPNSFQKPFYYILVGFYLVIILLAVVCRMENRSGRYIDGAICPIDKCLT